MIDPELSVAFALHENPRAFALLMGSGLSRAALIPTGWEITIDLVRRIGRLQGVAEQADWAAWYREATGRPPNYSELLDQLSSGPDERRAILHRYIEPTAEQRQQGQRMPTAAHRAIARLVAGGFVRVIITPNFDRLLEQALQEVGVEPTIIASDDAIAGAPPLLHCACWLIKVHGDYLDTRIRNTETELASYSPAMDALLGRILDEHGLLVCGWSGEWDPALRSAITRASGRRYPLFWVSRGEPSAAAADLIAARSGRLIRAEGADEFFQRLAERVQLQEEIGQPDPRSVALLVAAAKKYVASPEHRVQLHDLVSREVRRLPEVLPSPQSAMEISDATSFVRWVQRVEAALEPLASIVGVLGRWGGGEEAELAQRLVRARLQLPTIGGYTHLIGLREYPAILIAYAFGLGALAAGRLDRVHRLLVAPAPANGSEQEPFVRRHFLDWWAGGRNNEWNQLPGFVEEPLKSPLSEHLHAVFSDWAAPFVLDRAEFDELFDTFELLASLEGLIQHADAEALKVATAGRDRQRWIWTPLGRGRFDTELTGRVLERWRSPDGEQSLLGAGIGDPELLPLAITHLEQQISHRRYFG